MDVREKLIELIAKAKYIYANDYSDHTEDEYIADTLLDNGVTAQEWIAVEDRLPEIGRSVIIYNATAKCAAEAMHKGEGKFLQFRWSAKLQEQEVTHWMPLPSTEGLE